MGLGRAHCAFGADPDLCRSLAPARHGLSQRRAHRDQHHLLGQGGHETPTGVFTILQKDATHRSSVYNNAAMPYQQRLTWDGVALHAGGLPGYPESHGCVHLPYGFSQELFAITKLGVTVVVQGDAINHERTSDSSLLAPMDMKGKPLGQQSLADSDYVWQPQLAPTGPLTIIVSKADQRVVVLRNGIEIGRSVAQINDDDPGSHVVTLTTVGASRAGSMSACLAMTRMRARRWTRRR
jgi:hypothetical protein